MNFLENEFFLLAVTFGIFFLAKLLHAGFRVCGVYERFAAGLRAKAMRPLRTVVHTKAGNELYLLRQAV